jgi:superfamily II DNA/RNA helicase
MTSFSDLELDPKVLQAVADAGYETPTPIQVQAIPPALEGRDVLGIAQTGTGKTAGFVLPMITLLQKGRARARMPRSLVLCPTRELAAQVAENFEVYAKHVKLSMALLIGGTSFKDQDKLIDRGVDVLIATPGRLLDHFERGKLMLTGVQIMVVDEADRMLDMGFIPDIERIFKLTPFTRQTLFFSATMAPEITRITQEFLSNPVRVEVARQATASETIEQHVCVHKPARRDSADTEKREILRRIIRNEGDGLTNGIIFCNRKRDVDIVAKSLKKHGFDAEPIHGDLDQSVRTRVLEGFRNGDLRLLVASDVAARGLDIPSVSHVINFNVPIHAEDYVHRIGRTGRAGRQGKSITLCVPSEEKYLEKVEALIGKPIPRMDDPLKGEEIVKPKREGEARSSTRNAGSDKSRDQSAKSAASNKSNATDKPKSSEQTRSSDKPKSSAKPKTDRDTRNEPKRQGSERSSRGQRQDAVVGLGDHVPAFLMQDFRLEIDAAEAETDKQSKQSSGDSKSENAA